VFRYLHPSSLRDVLVQALLDSPMFEARWRWNTTVALAVPRSRHGRKVPPQIQRMMADDLLAAAFPDAAACLENIPGDRQIPDHPLVSQAIHDCLHEAMDLDRLGGILSRIHERAIECVARDTTEPSPLAHEILNARPYSFLDDAPLEERRTHAVYTRRASDPKTARDLGALDAEAIARVRAEAWPDPRDASELHDALMTLGVATDEEAASWARFLETLTASKRITRVSVPQRGAAAAVWVTAERLPELRAIHRDEASWLLLDPPVATPAARAGRVWSPGAALVELVRGRMSCSGPTTARELSSVLAVSEPEIDTALLALEAEGVVLRGAFTPAADDAAGGSLSLEWCDRTLLARIHRYTLSRLRAEIEPVSPADFMRFLFAWQHVSPPDRLSGLEGLRAAITKLDGFEAAADAWERAILPARVADYTPSMLDLLCLSGEVGWARLSSRLDSRDEEAVVKGKSVIRSSPVALFLREHLECWEDRGSGRDGMDETTLLQDSSVSDLARAILGALHERGASFARELMARTAASAGDVRDALAELVSAGLVTADGFAGLRAVIKGRARLRRSGMALDRSGRWSLVRPGKERDVADRFARDERAETQARVLLRRYGVVCRRLLAREPNSAPWRDLLLAYRRLEARGEIRGGRFVSGLSGEQFALSEAVAELRAVRRTPGDGALVSISAADPLNLSGIVTAGDRIPGIASLRVIYRDGVPIAVDERQSIRPLVPIDVSVVAAIARRSTRHAARAHSSPALVAST
jgi:ATP-dependent Lhr-like helicase